MAQDKTINTATKTMHYMAAVEQIILEAMLTFLYIQKADDRNANALYEYGEQHKNDKGALVAIPCADGIPGQYLSDELTKNGIISSAMQGILPGTGGKMREYVVVQDINSARAAEMSQRLVSITGLMGRYDTKAGLMAAGEPDQSSMGNIFLCPVKDVDPATAYWVGRNADKARCSVAIEPSADGKAYDIYCLPIHQEKLSRLLTEAQCVNATFPDLAKHNAERIQFEEAMKQKSNEVLANTKESFVICRENNPIPYLVVTPDGLEYHTSASAKTIRSSRTDATFKQDAAKCLNDIFASAASPTPVIVKEKDFSKDKKELHRVLNKDYGRPKPSMELSAMNKQARALVEKVNEMEREEEERSHADILLAFDLEKHETSLNESEVNFAEEFRDAAVAAFPERRSEITQGIKSVQENIPNMIPVRDSESNNLDGVISVAADAAKDENERGRNMFRDRDQAVKSPAKNH